MNVFLWIVQAILAVMFLGSGIAKSLMSKERMLATGQTGAASQPLPLIRFIAFCEILGATGLILPCALGIDRFLTPLAAVGLAAIMVGAARIHAKLGEPKSIVVNVLGCLDLSQNCKELYSACGPLLDHEHEACCQPQNLNRGWGSLIDALEAL